MSPATADAAFAVLYTFEVHPGAEHQFIEAWSDLTHLIRRHRGGLGSRLHRDAQGRFRAYAEWPSRAVFEADTPLPTEADEVIARMRATIATRHDPIELEIERDLLSSRGRPGIPTSE